jgi:hypothetical protein
VTALPAGISDLTLGIIVALVFGTIIFVVKCGKQCCDNIKWIIEVCKMNAGKDTEQKKGKAKKTESSVEELNKEEIEKLKEEISDLSQQVKTVLADISQVRKTQVLSALEGDIRMASTEYAMKFELKRSEYDSAMRMLQVTVAKMPDEAVAYKQKVNEWIDKAQKKFIEYSPENFEKKVEAVKAKGNSI